MRRVVVGQDCGNAPRKIFLRDFNIAFAENRVEFIVERLTDDICWHLVGARQIQGKMAFAEALQSMARTETSELLIRHIITHGATAAVEGSVKLENGETYAFCDVYQFNGHGKNAKIKAMTSYLIGVENHE